MLGRVLWKDDGGRVISFFKTGENQLEKQKKEKSLWVWVGIAFILRIVLLFLFSMHPKHTHSDMMFWIKWTEFF